MDTTLTTCLIKTPIGPLRAIATPHTLVFLKFDDQLGLHKEINQLCHLLNASIKTGYTAPLQQIERDLAQYFTGAVNAFHPSGRLIGTEIQLLVWAQILAIPPSQTTTYSHIAELIGVQKGWRAVGRAVAANQLLLVIPCHRVIQKDGTLGGYSGGIERKRWLIEHEKSFDSDATNNQPPTSPKRCVHLWSKRRYPPAANA
jgi:AraC family transcriptional regulator of adaptative response/methylated-DNA-[protein]-cysteine methyltransferase